MKLASAILCVQCETVFDAGEYQQCPSCTSRSLFPLARAIEPMEEAYRSAIESGAAVVPALDGRRTTTYRGDEATLARNGGPL